MPYAVWLEMDAPAPISDEAAGAQLPQLILELIEQGWESAAIFAVDDDDPSQDVAESADAAPDILDVRVLGHPVTLREQRSGYRGG
jgi:hypothetical protein